MVDPDPAGKHLAHLNNLGQLTIARFQALDTLGKEVLDVRLLHGRRQVEAGQERRVLVAPVPRQREGDDGQLIFAFEMIDQRQPDVALLLGSNPILGNSLLPAKLLLPLLLPGLLGILGLLVAFVQESASSVLEQKYLVLALAVGPCVQEMLEGHGPLEGADDVDLFLLGPSDPVRELQGVRHRRTQHDNVHMIREQDDNLFPNDSPLAVVDVVNLVKNDILEIADDVAAIVQHRPQDLRRHDQTRGGRVDLDITSDEADVVEGLLEIPELLV